MYVQIFGLSTNPGWWVLSRIPAGGGRELARVFRASLPPSTSLSFYYHNRPLEDYDRDELVKRWSTRPARIVAKPVGAQRQPPLESTLHLVTTTGPDAGRIFPLTRRNLSVGRSSARAQVRDPWVSAHEFEIRLSSQGTLLTPSGQSPSVLHYGEQFTAGSTEFDLQRGTAKSLRAPQDPGAFVINPGQPPSPPNLVLQVLGAAAPLLIGVVLMLVTGMWYFLLFSGVSVIIAAVLITQYRRAKKRFISDIQTALETTGQRFRQGVFTPHEMTSALMNPTPDGQGLAGPQPEHPVVNLGTSVRKAAFEQLQETKRWEPYLFHRVTSALHLLPGRRTVVVGDAAIRRPLKHWITAQLLRHSAATSCGVVIEDVHIGGAAAVEVVEGALPAVDPERHHVVFLANAEIAADAYTTLVDLDRQTIEGAYSATALAPYGISLPTLELVSKELLLDQPTQHLQGEHLSLAEGAFESVATHQLVTSLGSGTLGLSIDMVKDGPHMLITGTTGSGKSELLLTVLVGFAQRYPPGEVSMVLLDFKGGSSFNVLAPLPHAMSVETNHVAASSLRSLEAIAAELHRREALFADTKVADFETFRRTFPHRTLPRLIVAIDELRVLVEQNREAAATLAHLAATGRSLGFHLIVATQRTQGAVSADIRANLGSTIALRTATEHDSWDVLGTAEAFHISPNTPGRAYFKAGAAAPLLFQTGRYVLDSEPVVLCPYRGHHPADIASTTDWTKTVEEIRTLAANLPIPHPMILPALPSQLEVATLRHTFRPEPGQTPIGMVDDPANCQQYPMTLATSADTADQRALTKSVAWVGAADSGIDGCIQVVKDHVLRSSEYKVLLDGQRLNRDSARWDCHLAIDETTGDIMKELLDHLATTLESGVRTSIVLTEWGSWAHQQVTGSFQGFEERLIQLMRQFAPFLQVYVFGARELAGGRLLAMIPDRFYLPKNSSAEHQLVWPVLRTVQPLSARGVFVSADHASGGLEVQLCTA